MDDFEARAMIIAELALFPIVVLLAAFGVLVCIHAGLWPLAIIPAGGMVAAGCALAVACKNAVRDW